MTSDDGGGSSIGILPALILGVFIVMACIVLSAPEYAGAAWGVISSILWWIGVCLATLIIGIIVLFVIMVWANS